MKKILLSVIIFLSLFPSFNLVQASLCEIQGGLVPCDATKGCPCQLCHFIIMIDRIIKFLLFQIVPAVAALMIAIGGAMMIYAYAGGGGAEAINKARSLFFSVVVGLLIVYGAWLLIDAFFAVIGVKPIFRNWSTICS